jgi:multidrug efflux system membrane fusion protein
MRRRVIISAILGFAAFAIVAGFGITHRHIKAASAPAPVVPTAPVVAGTVASGDVPIYLQGVGTVIA